MTPPDPKLAIANVVREALEAARDYLSAGDLPDHPAHSTAVLVDRALALLNTPSGVPQGPAPAPVGLPVAVGADGVPAAPVPGSVPVYIVYLLPDDGMVGTLDANVFEKPEGWAPLIADMVGHVADAYARDRTQRQAIARSIRRAVLDALDAPDRYGPPAPPFVPEPYAIPNIAVPAAPTIAANTLPPGVVPPPPTAGPAPTAPPPKPVATVTGTCAGHLDIKRCYLPGLVLESACPTCGKVRTVDLESDYLGYPKVGKAFKYTFECWTCAEDEDAVADAAEWSVWLVLNVDLSVVPAPPPAEETP